jgi:hypothetical protein
MPIVTLQTLPYDVRFEILCSVYSLGDLNNLRQTCKALNEPAKLNETTLISIIAPRLLKELVRLDRALSWRRATSLDPDLEESLSSNIFEIPSIFAHATTKRLLSLAVRIREIARKNTGSLQLLYDLRNEKSHTETLQQFAFRVVCNAILIDTLVPGKCFEGLDTWIIEPWHGRKEIDTKRRRLEQVRSRFKSTFESFKDIISRAFPDKEIIEVRRFNRSMRYKCHFRVLDIDRN